MRIRDFHGRYRPVFSFEFFPPKTDEGASNLMRTVADLKDALAPDFVSVTYGAGGSTRARTLECVTRIQNDRDILRISNEDETRQRKRLDAIRHDRDQATVDAVLAKLRAEAADPEVNLMPTLIEASQVYATLGEMMGAMADVFGRYTEVPVI